MHLQNKKLFIKISGNFTAPSCCSYQTSSKGREHGERPWNTRSRATTPKPGPEIVERQSVAIESVAEEFKMR